MVISPTQSKTFSQLYLYPPIRACITWWRNSGTTHLYLSISICNCPTFFSECRGRKNNIRIICSFCYENILDNQMLELRKSVTGMNHVWIRHRRIFTQNVHTTYIASVDSVHYLCNCQSFVCVQGLVYATIPCPHISKFCPHIITDNSLHIRQKHWD